MSYEMEKILKHFRIDLSMVNEGVDLGKISREEKKEVLKRLRDMIDEELN